METKTTTKTEKAIERIIKDLKYRRVQADRLHNFDRGGELERAITCLEEAGECIKAAEKLLTMGEADKGLAVK